MAEVTERLPEEYAVVGERLFGLTEPSEIYERLRTDESLRYQHAQEIVDDAHRHLDAARAVMGDWFATLPQAPCHIEPVPAYLGADAPAAYYFPPAGDGSRPGTYFVNTHEPTDKNRYEAASVAFHEAIPGHHLQIAIANELTDVPSFQRFALSNTAYVEGWGLYAERLADEMGLYTTDLDRIGMLAADSWRACRLVVDTGTARHGLVAPGGDRLHGRPHPGVTSPRSRSRSTATSACRPRPWPTRSASARSSASGPTRGVGSAKPSTSRASTTPRWARALSRWACSGRSLTAGCDPRSTPGPERSRLRCTCARPEMWVRQAGDKETTRSRDHHDRCR